MSHSLTFSETLSDSATDRALEADAKLRRDAHNAALEEAAKMAAWCHMNYVPSADIARHILALKDTPLNGVTATSSDAASDAATRRPPSSLPVTRSDVLEEGTKEVEHFRFLCEQEGCDGDVLTALDRAAGLIRSLKDTPTASGEARKDQ